MNNKTKRYQKKLQNFIILRYPQPQKFSSLSLSLSFTLDQISGKQKSQRFQRSEQRSANSTESKGIDSGTRQRSKSPV